MTQGYLDQARIQSLFSDHASYDLDATPDRAHDCMACGGDVGLGPYSAVMLSQDA